LNFNMNEAKTRQDIIDQRLAKAGWNVNNPSQVKSELGIKFTKSGSVEELEHIYDGHQYADYALLGDDGYPLAVVEAKKSSRDARIGQEQAKQYAKNIQSQLKGKLPFVFYTNGNDIYFWDTEKYPPRKVYGFPTKKDLERLMFLREHEKPLSKELINVDISGRPYQIEAIRSVFEGIDHAKRKFLLVMATGTGKTRTCVSMIDVLMRTNRIQRVLFLVDRIALGNQALDAFREYLPNAPLWPQRNETKFVTNRRVYVTTYQTMLNIIDDEGYGLSPHFFDLIVADESHRSIYNVYKNIFDYFDALQIGLTATPKDALERNTFKLFQCEDGLPTFAYSYEEALKNNPPYLCDFEVLKIRTWFLEKGIRKDTISIEDQKRLLKAGKEPSEINYEGTEIEKSVTNLGTNTLIVREFMEECIKDESGVLPGKTIFFAMTIAHAHRLREVFDDLFPEYKGEIAKVIVSEDPKVYGKGGLLDQFVNKNFPRIAISVDMLDTGLDVRELVNLVFAKPVFSYTKFWQMIGRGTRLLEPKKIKPWCKTKDKFLIIDCWGNFDYFMVETGGETEKQSIPLPVRLFLTRLQKLTLAHSLKKDSVIEDCVTKLKAEIAYLPQNNVVILDARTKLEQIDLNYWSDLTKEKIEFLQKEIAPLMRTRSGEDYEAMYFELKVLLYSIAKIDEKQEKKLRENLLSRSAKVIIEMVSDLPLNVNVVAKQKDLINSVLTGGYLQKAGEPELNNLVEKLGPLMKLRDPVKQSQVSLDLQDVTHEKGYIKFGPEHERITVQKYRDRVQTLIKNLENKNIVLRKIKMGESITDEELNQLAATLQENDPYPTEENLQKAYEARKVKFLDLIKYIMGVSGLVTFPQKVTTAFDGFIAEHNNLTTKQIQFIQTLQSFIIENGELSKKDLVSEPFTKFHNNGFLGLFDHQLQQEILQLTDRILNYA
jgi:type I restriction enzyme R subunit